MNSTRNRENQHNDEIMKTFTAAAIGLGAGIGLNWFRLKELRFKYNEIAPYVAELDQQASEAWLLFNGAANLLLIGLAALAFGILLLIAWIIYRLWLMRTLMKKLQEA